MMAEALPLSPPSPLRSLRFFSRCSAEHGLCVAACRKVSDLPNLPAHTAILTTPKSQRVAGVQTERLGIEILY